MKKVFLILLFIFSCSNDNSENQPIGQANPELGIENIIPSNLGKEYSANFNRYTKVVTPNGGKIHIVAQSNLTASVAGILYMTQNFRVVAAGEKHVSKNPSEMP